MKFVCERDALNRVLSFVSRRASTKPLIPILTHVKLSADARELLLSTTDLDAYNEAKCPVEAEEPGAACVPAERLARLIEGLPQGAQVTISATQREMSIKCGSSRYKLPTMPPEDFPEMPAATEPAEFSLGCVDVKRLFSEPVTAITVNGARLMMEGGCLYQDAPNTLSIVGADGIRLIKRTMAASAQLSRRYIVPKGCMSDIVKLATDGEVTFRCGKNLIEAHRGNFRFASKLIEAEYPNLDPILPAPATRFIMVDRAEFIAAFKRLVGLASEHSTLNVAWKPDEPEIELSINGAGSGIERVSCSCDLPAGQIAFMPNVLGPMLDIHKGEILQLHIIDAHKGMRIVDPNDPDLTVFAWPCAAKNASQEAA